MPSLRTADAVLFYTVRGSGPDLVLLHPFPLNHHFWDAIVPMLSDRYRVLTLDLRGHGDSELGEGVPTMQKHAADLYSLCRTENVARAVFVGVSIGGYILFEFWRQHPDQFAALVLSNTRANPDDDESRANRLQIADRVLQQGTAWFIEDMLQKLLGNSTREHRPDVVGKARRMMQAMSPEDIAGVQRGMAGRPDSIATLSTINVPSLVIAGDEDIPPLSAAELMHECIAGSELQIIAKAGHYAALEQPEGYSNVLGRFVDDKYGKGRELTEQ